jgi:hypothetical protein
LTSWPYKCTFCVLCLFVTIFGVTYHICSIKKSTHKKASYFCQMCNFSLLVLRPFLFLFIALMYNVSRRRGYLLCSTALPDRVMRGIGGFRTRALRGRLSLLLDKLEENGSSLAYACCCRLGHALSGRRRAALSSLPFIGVSPMRMPSHMTH